MALFSRFRHGSMDEEDYLIELSTQSHQVQTEIGDLNQALLKNKLNGQQKQILFEHFIQGKDLPLLKHPLESSESSESVPDEQLPAVDYLINLSIEK